MWIVQISFMKCLFAMILFGYQTVQIQIIACFLYEFIKNPGLYGKEETENNRTLKQYYIALHVGILQIL